MLIFLFYQARFILTFKNIFVLVIDVQQLEKISSLARTKLRSPYYMLGVGANGMK